MSPATAEAVELARGMKDRKPRAPELSPLAILITCPPSVELSTEAQRSFFEFKALLENAHERGRQLLELTGDKVAEHVVCCHPFYRRCRPWLLPADRDSHRVPGKALTTCTSVSRTRSSFSSCSKTG